MHKKTLCILISVLVSTIALLHCGTAISESPVLPSTHSPSLGSVHHGWLVPAPKTAAITDGPERVLAGLTHGLAEGKGAGGPADIRETPPDNALDEVQAMKERIIEAQNKGKLGFRKMVACRSVESFGAYSPLEPGQKVEKIVFYFEPSNVSTLKSGDRYIIDCAVDFILMDTSGKVLAGKQNALKLNRVSRSPVIDLFFRIDIGLKKPSDRPVLLKTVLHDKIKNETVSATKTINVENPHKSNLDGV
jgi:hypothetical protein